MKHKTITIVCLVTLVALSVLAATTWHTQAVQEHVQAAKTYAKQQYHDQLQKAAVAAEKKRINDECHSNQAFYDAQAAAYKKANPSRPVCDLEIVQ